MKICLIFREKLTGVGAHYGVLIGNERVIDFQADVGFRSITLEEFRQNKKITIEQEENYSPAIEERFKKLISENNKYDLLLNNCEHNARMIVAGVKRSTQINFLLGLCAMIFIGFITDADVN